MLKESQSEDAAFWQSQLEQAKVRATKLEQAAAQGQSWRLWVVAAA